MKTNKKTNKKTGFVAENHHHKLLDSVSALFFLIMVSAVFLFLYLAMKDVEGPTMYLSDNIGQQTDPNINNVGLISEKQKQYVLSKVDSSNWEAYSNKWYGFKLKYPSGWENPGDSRPSKNSKWEYKYEFRKKKEGNSEIYSGFDVVAYDLKKVEQGISETETITNATKVDDDDLCLSVDSFLAENGFFSAKMVNIPSGEDCYHPTFFYTVQSEKYLFNIIPIGSRSEFKFGDVSDAVLVNFPEFYIISNTFELIDIERPKPKPVITAPYPVAYKKQGGRLVCSKDNDKPAKSKQGKGIHLDMECCLDPDEIPNPHCYYPLEKYAKVFEQIKNRK